MIAILPRSCKQRFIEGWAKIYMGITGGQNYLDDKLIVTKKQKT